MQGQSLAHHATVPDSILKVRVRPQLGIHGSVAETIRAKSSEATAEEEVQEMKPGQPHPLRQHVGRTDSVYLPGAYMLNELSMAGLPDGLVSNLDHSIRDLGE